MINFGIKIIVHGKPPAKSNNYRIVRAGKFYRIVPTQAIVDYEEKIAKIALNIVQVFEKDILYPDPRQIEIAIIWHRNNRRRADLDNIAKAINDGLTKGKIWSDDKQITEIHMSMRFGKFKEDWIEIYISPLEEE